MTESPLKLLVLGAHPDDAEFHAGGLSCKYSQHGHIAKLISVTNGGAGHHRLDSAKLVATRRAEAAASGNVIGSTYETWEFPDGRLTASIEVRERIIREIRTFAPDLVLTHRINDYHPDHRAVGQAVQDASYMVTVPLVVPEVPIVEREPVVAYMPDLFTKPCPLEPDVIFPIDDYIPKIVEMLACHRSQVFDFLPFNQGILAQVPQGEEAKMEWLRTWFLGLIEERTPRFHDEIVAQYGSQRAASIQYIEAFEVSEYAGSADNARIRELFLLDA